MKILPMMSRGVVFLHGDGRSFEMAPMHVHQNDRGQTVIRLGKNTYVFAADGSFAGEECDIALEAFNGNIEKAVELGHAITEALLVSSANAGEAPTELYYEARDERRLAEQRSIDELSKRKPKPRSDIIYATGPSPARKPPKRGEEN